MRRFLAVLGLIFGVGLLGSMLVRLGFVRGWTWVAIAISVVIISSCYFAYMSPGPVPAGTTAPPPPFTHKQMGFALLVVLGLAMGVTLIYYIIAGFPQTTWQYRQQAEALDNILALKGRSVGEKAGAICLENIELAESRVDEIFAGEMSLLQSKFQARLITVTQFANQSHAITQRKAQNYADLRKICGEFMGSGNSNTESSSGNAWYSAWWGVLKAPLKDPNVFFSLPGWVQACIGVVLLAAAIVLVLGLAGLRPLTILAAVVLVVFAAGMLIIAGTIGVAPANAGGNGPSPHPKGAGCGSSRTMSSGDLRLERQWHSTECYVPVGGYLDFQVISYNMHSDVFPNCKPSPKGCDRGDYEGELLCDDLPPVSLVGKINNECIFLGERGEGRIHSNEYGAGLLELSVNLPVKKPGGTPAKIEWINLVGSHGYMVE